MNNILLINNNKTFALYYSYSNGIKSKRDYILLFKSWYIFSNFLFLDKLYKNIINDKVDILEFNLLVIYDGNNINGDNLSIYKCSHINTEIQLNFF